MEGLLFGSCCKAAATNVGGVGPPLPRGGRVGHGRAPCAPTSARAVRLPRTSRWASRRRTSATS
eukprot:15443395-Alexandrium_andersonii.AAC.1